MPKSSKKISVSIKPVKSKRKRRSRGSRRNAGYAGAAFAGMDPTVDYCKSLVNPFECTPPRLGWGCMVPSNISQAYYRSTAAASTDGNLAVMALPCVAGGILFNTGIAGSTTWVGQSYSNAGAIIANFGEARPISIGIKATPSIALSSAPGFAYAGAFTPTNTTNVVSLANGDLSTFVTSHQSIALNGVEATGRPIDPDSFTFQVQVCDNQGWNTTANKPLTLPFSIPYVYFTGMPAGTAVAIEVCFNFEATQVIAHGATTVMPAQIDYSAPAVSDNFPTSDAFMRKVGPLLPPSGRASDTAASSDSSFLSTLLSGLGGVAGTILGGPVGTAIGTFGGKMLGSLFDTGTPSQALRNPSVTSRPGASQRFGAGYKGYYL